MSWCWYYLKELSFDEHKMNIMHITMESWSLSASSSSWNDRNHDVLTQGNLKYDVLFTYNNDITLHRQTPLFGVCNHAWTHLPWSWVCWHREFAVAWCRWTLQGIYYHDGLLSCHCCENSAYIWIKIPFSECWVSYITLYLMHNLNLNQYSVQTAPAGIAHNITVCWQI